MLAQHLHHAPAGSEFTAVGILGEIFGHPGFFGDFIDRFQAIGLRFVGSKNAKAIHIQAHDFPQ